MLRTSIVKICILNAKSDIFGIFNTEAAAEVESRISNWRNDSSVCDLSDGQIEAGCLRHEVKSERVAARRISNFEKVSIRATNKEMGQLVTHRIYIYIMDIFVFGLKNASTAIFKDSDTCFMIGWEIS